VGVVQTTIYSGDNPPEVKRPGEFTICSQQCLNKQERMARKKKSQERESRKGKAGKVK
jgi:hypothetical protein